jgi:hypothetical protein
MTWLRLDDRFAEHPKIAGLSNQAFRDHVAAMCYCARNRTKGRVSAGVIRLLRISPKTVAELTKAVVWDQGEDCDYFIHDWATFNPPAREMTDEEKAAEAERKAAAGRLGGLASGAARRSAKEADEAETKQNLLQNEAETKQTDEAETNPRNPYPVTRIPSASNEASEEGAKRPATPRKPRPFLDEPQRAELHRRWDSTFPLGATDVDERLAIAMGHANAKKYGDGEEGWFPYANGWLKGDAAKLPGGYGNGTLRQGNPSRNGNSRPPGTTSREEWIAAGFDLGDD